MKDKLDTIASPHILRFGHNEIKGAWTSLSNWEQLPDGYPAMEVVLGGDSGVALLATFHLILHSHRTRANYHRLVVRSLNPQQI